MSAPSPAEAALEIRGAGYAIGGKRLVSDLSLTLQPGRLLVIVGPNGAGKSTLLRLLSGEILPDAGHVAYFGEPARAIPAWRLACIRAVLPQASRLSFPFTVSQVVQIGLDGIGRRLARSAKRQMLADALARADVAHLAARNYQTLSGGEQQRTQFARVLAQLAAGRSVANRQILLLDEPITSLDLKHQLALLDAAAAIAREGVAVAAILHDLNLAAAYADEIAVIKDGRLVATGAPAAIMQDAMLSDVFGVALKVGALPEGDRPFVLPQASIGMQPGS